MKIKKNGKIITLTESDLKRIVGVVLREDTKGDPGKDFAQCCKEAGITPPMSCVAGDPGKCMEELGKMITNDPLGMGMKALVALNCLKDKVTSGGVVNKQRAIFAAQMSKIVPVSEAIERSLVAVRPKGLEKNFMAVELDEVVPVEMPGLFE
jgi:hypothetical protein